jgi:acylphosphatase
MAIVHLRIAGRVQGVGYRYALQHEAVRLGITGWVRNCADGSVEALAQGPQQALDALTAWARHGPPAARVSEVTATPGATDGKQDYEAFVIAPST